MRREFTLQLYDRVEPPKPGADPECLCGRPRSEHGSPTGPIGVIYTHHFVDKALVA